MQPRLFFERQVLDVEVQTVVGQGVERNVRADVGCQNVVGRECFCLGFVELIVANTSPSDDERVDT